MASLLGIELCMLLHFDNLELALIVVYKVSQAVV